MYYGAIVSAIWRNKDIILNETGLALDLIVDWFQERLHTKVKSFCFAITCKSFKETIVNGVIRNTNASLEIYSEWFSTIAGANQNNT